MIPPKQRDIVLKQISVVDCNRFFICTPSLKKILHSCSLKSFNWKISSCILKSAQEVVVKIFQWANNTACGFCYYDNKILTNSIADWLRRCFFIYVFFLTTCVTVSKVSKVRCDTGGKETTIRWMLLHHSKAAAAIRSRPGSWPSNSSSICRVGNVSKAQKPTEQLCICLCWVVPLSKSTMWPAARKGLQP